MPKASSILKKISKTAIERDGKQFTVRAGNIQEAIIALQRQQQAEEQVVNVLDKIPCFPLDGLVSLTIALEETFGFAALANTPGFFGSNPPTLVQVPVKDGFKTAPFGRIQPAGWENGYIQTQIASATELIISGQVKRKFEPQVKELIGSVRENLKKHSIYKGQAVTLDLSFMNEGDERDFDPMNDAPKFFDYNGLDESMLILTKETERQLKANLWMLIEQSELMLRYDVPLKHGCLLEGPYGTGKSMCMKVTAQKAVHNGWTFILLKHASQLPLAIRVGAQFAPTIVAMEDGDESAFTPDMLYNMRNTLDGVDTKGQPIIVLMTTNHPDRIDNSIRRAGRIDTKIHIGLPDAETAERFIRLYAVDDDGHSLLDPAYDIRPVAEKLAGFVPAFIAESVHKAKRYAILREQGPIEGKLNTDDLLAATADMKDHYDWANKRIGDTNEEIVAKSMENQFQYLHGNVHRLHRFIAATE